MPRKRQGNLAGARTPHKQHRGLEGKLPERIPAQRQDLDGCENFIKWRLRCQRGAAAEMTIEDTELLKALKKDKPQPEPTDAEKVKAEDC